MQAQNPNLKLRKHYEGQLSKYTNVMKGWQYRWFVLIPEKGTLEYYVSKNEIKGQVPRGILHLAAAEISPSEEDSHTFVVHSASGDVYKLRAVDAKERQEWITRLRVVAQIHSQALAQSNSPLVSREFGSSSSYRGVVPTNLSILDAFAQVQQWLCSADRLCRDVGQSIDKFPISGSNPVKCTDRDLLIFKATSQATLACLEECLFALEFQQRATANAKSRVAASSSGGGVVIPTGKHSNITPSHSSSGSPASSGFQYKSNERNPGGSLNSSNTQSSSNYGTSHRSSDS